MTLDLRTCTLVHYYRFTPCKGVSSSLARLNLLHNTWYQVRHLLDYYPELTNVSLAILCPHMCKDVVRCQWCPLKIFKGGAGSAYGVRFYTKIYTLTCRLVALHWLQQSWGLGLGVWSSGFGVRGLGFGIWDQGYGIGVWGLLSGICGLKFETGVWDSRFEIEGLIFWVQDLGSGIWGLGFDVWDSESRIHGPRFRASDSGSGIHGPWFTTQLFLTLKQAQAN